MIYLKQKGPVSAFEIAEKMKAFGDIYVVKDSATACFVEFQYIIVGDEECNLLIGGGLASQSGDVGETDEATQLRRV